MNKTQTAFVTGAIWLSLFMGAWFFGLIKFLENDAPLFSVLDYKLLTQLLPSHQVFSDFVFHHALIVFSYLWDLLGLPLPEEEGDVFLNMAKNINSWFAVSEYHLNWLSNRAVLLGYIGIPFVLTEIAMFILAHGWFRSRQAISVETAPRRNDLAKNIWSISGFCIPIFCVSPLPVEPQLFISLLVVHTASTFFAFGLRSL